MFRIGVFSKVCQVSIKTLRYWDEVGLLAPHFIDRESGYRYYHIDQLDRINRILAYKGLGLSLNQVKQLLEENLSVEEIRGMLRLKQAEIQEQIENSQAMLRMVESRLQQMDRGERLMDDPVTLKTAAPLDLLAIRYTVKDMAELVELIRQTDLLRQTGELRGAGAIHAVFHDEAFATEAVDVTIGFPVESVTESVMVSENWTLAATGLPGIETVATLLHKGSWLSLPQGYGALGAWIARNDYRIDGPGREIFHHIGWEGHEEDTMTEIQFPVVSGA